MKLSWSLVRQTLVLALALGCVAPAFAQSRKVNEANLYRYWILLNRSVTLEAPNSGRNLMTPGCAAVTYMVGSDGIPRDVKLAKVAPPSDLGVIATNAVKQFRYGPSLTNGKREPVATYYVVPFNSPDDPAARKKLMAPCQLPGYPG